MPTKKVNKSRRENKSVSDVQVELEEKNHELLQRLQSKVMSSAALNGGFDKLMLKIESIEDKQQQLVLKIEEIHNAVYHPDDGLFARVKDVSIIAEKAKYIDELETSVKELEKHVADVKKSDAVQTATHDENEKIIQQQADQLRDLLAFKSNALSIAKWLGITIGTGSMGMLGKLLYSALAGHIHIE